MLYRTENRLPLVTPYGTISTAESEIIASSSEEEMVLRMESKTLKGSAEFVLNQNCAVEKSAQLGRGGPLSSLGS